MSGSGGVSTVTLRQPASAAGTVTFEVKILDCFEEILENMYTFTAFASLMLDIISLTTTTMP